MSGIKTSRCIAIAAWVALSFPLPAQDLLFSDSFSARQGEHPPSWTIIGAPTPRFWFVENNQLVSGPGQDLGDNGYSYAVISAPGSENWTDYSLGTEFWMRSRNGRVALVCRWRDARNFYEGYVQVARDKRSAYIDLVRDGARKTLAYGVSGVGFDIPSIEGATDRPHYLQLTAVGQILALYLDGKRVIEVTDNAFDRGTAGLGVQYCMVTFDNAMVNRAKIVGPVAEMPRLGAGAASGLVYRFLMGTYDTEAEAKRFQGELIGGGYLNVTVEPAGPKWDVLVGAFANEIEATQERANLESQGVLIPNVVVRTGGTTQYFAMARRRPALPDKVYTLYLGNFAKREDAEALKRKLELDGFFGSELRAEGTSTTVVLGSFRSPDDAEKYRKLLLAGNYPRAEIREEKPSAAPGPAVIAATQVPAAIAQSDIWKTLTPEQRKEFERIMQAQSAAGGDAALIMDVKKEVEKLRLETREKIADLVNNVEQRETKGRQLAALFTKINKAAFAGQYDEARKGLKEIFAIDPENSMARLIEQQIDLRQNTLGKTIDERLTQAQRQQLDREIVAARQRAESFEREQYYQNALLEYQTLLALLENNNREPQAQNEIRDKIRALNTAVALSRGKEVAEGLTTLTTRVVRLGGRVDSLDSGQSNLRTSFEQTRKLLPYFVGVLGALTLVVVWVFFSSRRRNRLLLEQMRSLTLKPMMEISGGGAAAAVLPGREKPARELSSAGAASPPALESKAPSLPPSPASAALDGMPFYDPLTDPLAGGTGTAVAEPAPTVLSKPVEEEPSPFLEEVSPKTARSPKAPLSVSAPTGLSAEEEEEVSMMEEHPNGGGHHVPTFEVEPDMEPLRLDDIVVEPEATAHDATPVPPLPSDSTALDLDLMGVGMVEPEAPPVTGGFAPGVFYEQSYDEESTGTTPRNWNGSQESYGFATLKVADQTPAPNSSRYMRFEKGEGVGSAYYSCKFPDATGQVAIEFDLRCDTKNKFLLGFYVEKDGDFRQSIHTIIHQPEAKGASSLRIQGEAIPYEMGTWRHIKYLVNLSTGRLSGYVNGETVLDNIRLTNCPRSLNTLSIRDNIPTTGVLLIDNIRIARA